MSSIFACTTREQLEEQVHNGADLFQICELGESLLYSACKLDRQEIVECCLEAGLDVNFVRDWGTTPLHVAASRSRLTIIVLLIEAGASVNAIATDGWKTPFYNAVISNRIDVARLLLENGADPNNLRVGRYSPIYDLFFSVECAEEMLTFLLENGSDVNGGTISPLFSAILNNSETGVRLLLENGANINVNSNDLTPVEFARKMTIDEQLRARLIEMLE